MADDYTNMSMEELEAELARLSTDKPEGWTKAIRNVSAAMDKLEKAEKQRLREQMEKVLQESLPKITKAFSDTYKQLKADGVIPAGADGIWFSYDEDEPNEKGINPSCRITRTRKRSGGGNGSGSGSYVANPAKTADLLKEHGDKPMFDEATKVTIAGVEHDLPAGFTFNDAAELSKDNGWRNRYRMQLLKVAGLI